MDYMYACKQDKSPVISTFSIEKRQTVQIFYLICRLIIASILFSPINKQKNQNLNSKAKYVGSL